MAATTIDNPKRMTRRSPNHPCHVVAIPVQTNSREQCILAQRMLVRGKLYNATLQAGLERLDVLCATPEWKQTKQISDPKLKNVIRQNLVEQAKLTRFSLILTAQQIRRDSKWMPDLIQSCIADDVGSQVAIILTRYRLGKIGRPNFQPVRRTNVVWSTSNHTGIFVRNGKLYWPTRKGAKDKLARKSLELELDLSGLTTTRRQFIETALVRRVARTGLQRKIIRGKTRYYALVCLDGLPYRSPDYLSLVRSQLEVGIDMGPQKAHLVSESASVHLDLISDQTRANRGTEAKWLARHQRAVQRSRRAVNSHAFRSDGSHVQGQRVRKISKRGESRQVRIRERARVLAEQRKQDRILMARMVLRHGVHLVTEKIHYRSWQRLYGKIMALSSPGDFEHRLGREAKLLGGTLTLLPAVQCALSQRCLCGARVEKALLQRVHQCFSCGLGPLDRDFFSAYLALLVHRHGLQIVEAGFPSSGEIGKRYREQALRLCALRVPAPNPLGFDQTRSKAGGSVGSDPFDGASQPALQSRPRAKAKAVLVEIRECGSVGALESLLLTHAQKFAWTGRIAPLTSR